LILLTEINYSLLKPNLSNDRGHFEGGWGSLPLPLSLKILILLTKINYSLLKPNLSNDRGHFEGGGGGTREISETYDFQPPPGPSESLNEATLISLIKIDTFSYANRYFETFSSDRSF
jgi:hypothetical protein